MKHVIAVLLSVATVALATAPALAGPPSAPRTLQAGVDLEVGQEIATGSGDRAHIVFPDGSALTLGPLSQLVVDRLSPDDVIVNLRQGSARFVTSATSKSLPSVIATPSSTLTVRDGTAIVSVTARSTLAILVEGVEMKVVANGRTEIVSQPGWQATTLAGAVPGAPVPTPGGIDATELAQLDTR
jgi:ferric-dicitrate binding protein FerR (iron transport regulator)